MSLPDGVVQRPQWWSNLKCVCPRDCARNTQWASHMISLGLVMFIAVLYVIEPLIITANMEAKNSERAIDYESMIYHEFVTVKDALWASTDWMHTSLKQDRFGYGVLCTFVYTAHVASTTYCLPLMITRDQRWGLAVSVILLQVLSIMLNTMFRVPIPYDTIHYDGEYTQWFAGIVANPAHNVLAPRLGTLWIVWHSYFCQTPLAMKHKRGWSLRAILQRVIYLVVAVIMPSIFVCATRQVNGVTLCLTWSASITIYYLVATTRTVSKLMWRAVAQYDEKKPSEEHQMIPRTVATGKHHDTVPELGLEISSDSEADDKEQRVTMNDNDLALRLGQIARTLPPEQVRAAVAQAIDQASRTGPEEEYEEEEEEEEEVHFDAEKMPYEIDPVDVDAAAAGNFDSDHLP